MTYVDELDQLWSGPLSDIRDVKFSAEHDQQIRQVLSKNFVFQDSVPLDVVRHLWFMPMYLEWQTERISEYLPNEDQRYRKLTAWVFERVGEILGYP